MIRPGKYDGPGKRVNVYIPAKQLKIAVQIDNLSQFFQIALDNAPDIMAYAILRKEAPERFETHRKIDDYVDDFNRLYPPNELTQKRIDKNEWPKNSPNQPEAW